MTPDSLRRPSSTLKMAANRFADGGFQGKGSVIRFVSLIIESLEGGETLIER
jgi:hypothetical protein